MKEIVYENLLFGNGVDNRAMLEFRPGKTRKILLGCQKQTKSFLADLISPVTQSYRMFYRVMTNISQVYILFCRLVNNFVQTSEILGFASAVELSDRQMMQHMRPIDSSDASLTSDVVFRRVYFFFIAYTSS